MSDADAIRVELVRERSLVPLSKEEWNCLAAANATNTIFQTYEWFDAWWSVFGARHELFLLILRKGSRAIGFAPFMVRRVLPGVRQLEFIGTGNADYLDVVLPTDEAEGARALCAFLRAHSREWRRAWLANVPEQSRSLHHLKASGLDAGLYFVEEVRAPCPALRIAGNEKSVERLLRKYSIRRPMNWFSRRGVVRLRRIDSLAEITEKLPIFFDQHVQRWRSTRNGSLFENPQQRLFYTALADRMRDTPWLQFSTVELNNEPIAFHFGFDYAGTVTWYKPSFEARWAEHSPGLLLIERLIDDALKRGRAEVDFTVGDELFKRRFANRQEANLYIGVYHSSLQRRAAMVLRKSRREAGRWLRLLPGFRGAAQA